MRQKCRRAKFHPLKKKKSLREVSAYSTVCPEQACGNERKSRSNQQLRGDLKNGLDSMLR